MEVLLGLVGKDFILAGTDTSVIRSITVLKSTEDKSRPLNAHNVLFYSGEPGDTVQFAEYIQKNSKLFTIINNGLELTTSEVTSFTRRELAQSLRSRHPYNVNMLIGGWSKVEGPKLYWLDYLGSSASVPFAAHGYGAYYVLSLMDRHYHPDLTVEEAKALMGKCLKELQTRFIINLPNFKFKLVDETGTHEVEITPQ